jgi:hypothetical protein
MKPSYSRMWKHGAELAYVSGTYAAAMYFAEEDWVLSE